MERAKDEGQRTKRGTAKDAKGAKKDNERETVETVGVMGAAAGPLAPQCVLVQRESDNRASRLRHIRHGFFEA